jgi:hypothetical protein
MLFYLQLAEDFLAGEQSSNAWEGIFNKINKMKEIIISKI